MFEHSAYPPGVQNSFLGTRQMLMHEKNLCDPYIKVYLKTIEHLNLHTASF